MVYASKRDTHHHHHRFKEHIFMIRHCEDHEVFLDIFPAVDDDSIASEFLREDITTHLETFIAHDGDDREVTRILWASNNGRTRDRHDLASFVEYMRSNGYTINGFFTSMDVDRGRNGGMGSLSMIGAPRSMWGVLVRDNILSDITADTSWSIDDTGEILDLWEQ